MGRMWRCAAAETGHSSERQFTVRYSSVQPSLLVVVILLVYTGAYTTTWRRRGAAYVHSQDYICMCVCTGTCTLQVEEAVVVCFSVLLFHICLQ